MKHIIHILFILLFHNVIIANDKINISCFSVTSGMPSNETFCGEYDDLGFLWFGTKNGLSRYDGYSFKNINLSKLLSDGNVSNSIKLMEKDKNGFFWLITEKDDVYVFDSKVMSLTNVPIEVYIKGSINDILITNDNEIYLGTGQGIFKYSKSLNCFMFIKKMSVKSMFEDSKENIWIGTWNAGVCLFDRQSYKTIRYKNVESKFGITAFAEDNKGHIWISTWDGDFLYCLLEPDKFDSKKVKLIPAKGFNSVLPDPVIYDLMFDDEHGCLWVSTANGIVVMDLSEAKEKYTYFKSDELGGAEAMFLMKDANGSIWSGIEGSGVSSFVYRDDFYSHVVPDVAKDQVITALFEDEDSLIWIGSRKEVLQIWDRKNNKLKSYKEFPILGNLSAKSNSVVSIVKDSKSGNLFLGTRYNGVYEIGRQGTKITALEKLQHIIMNINRITDLSISSDGRLWIGTESGVFYADVNGNGKYKIKEYTNINKVINNDFISGVFCDNSGVWILTKTHGVLFWGVNEDIRCYNAENAKININSTSCIFKDSYGYLWLGTHGGGLSRYNDKNDCFDTQEVVRSLADEYVYSITEDNDKNLWITTNRGLFRLSLNNSKRIVWYNQRGDLQNLQFVSGASLVASDGTVILGGYSGLDCYERLDVDRIREYVSPVYIVDISLMNIPLSSINDDRSDVCDFLPPYTRKLYLKYNQNNLAFKFSCLSFINSSANMYAYRMLGVDNGWIYVDSSSRNISYNALKKGNYRFEVKACNTGVWSDIRYIDIVVQPAPWFTVWAYVLYVIVLFLICYIIVRTIKKRIHLQHALQLERLEHKKSDEVNQAKLKFFTNVSHELFTPISVLQCSIDKLFVDENSDKETLSIMRSNLKRLHRLLQQILEFRKIENGKLKLKVSKNDIVLFTRKLCEENFYPLVEAKHINMHFEASSDCILAYFDIDKLDKILYNLLSNALKYNYTRGVISISLTEQVEADRRYVVIKIENTGDGIPESRLPFLFQRFYEGDYRKFKTSGTGIGLSLTKELVDMHNGTINADSVPGEVTVFTVKLPIDKDAYTDDQIDNAKLDTGAVPVNADLEDGRFSASHILLVEDDEDLLTVISKFLSVSFNVHTAKNGVEAIEITKQCSDIDMIITDFVMPEMNGVELCKAIRSDKDLNHIPIIMLTAKTQVEYQLEGYNSGVDVYISKPVEMAVLIAQVKTLLNNRRILSQKFRQQEVTDTQELGLNAADQVFLDKAVQAVYENIDNSDFSIDDFCEQMNMSQSTLYRKLKTLTGMSANEFIRNVRIKKACEILRTTGKSVSEVAYMVGFNDPKYFGIVFKKELGMSPSKYVEGISENKI